MKIDERVKEGISETRIYPFVGESAYVAAIGRRRHISPGILVHGMDNWEWWPGDVRLLIAALEKALEVSSEQETEALGDDG